MRGGLLYKALPFLSCGGNTVKFPMSLLPTEPLTKPMGDFFNARGLLSPLALSSFHHYNGFAKLLFPLNLIKRDAFIGRSEANILLFGVFFDCYPFHTPKV